MFFLNTSILVDVDSLNKKCIIKSHSIGHLYFVDFLLNQNIAYNLQQKTNTVH